jgi:hypothetical protein
MLPAGKERCKRPEGAIQMPFPAAPAGQGADVRKRLRPAPSLPKGLSTEALPPRGAHLRVDDRVCQDTTPPRPPPCLPAVLSEALLGYSSNTAPTDRYGKLSSSRSTITVASLVSSPSSWTASR